MPIEGLTESFSWKVVMDWLPFVGISVGLVSVGIALAGLILATTRNTRADIRALSERVSRLEQSQAHTAGLIEGLRDSLFDRARRVGTGDRVAESSESYDPQG